MNDRGPNGRKIVAIIHSGHENDSVYCENMEYYFTRAGYYVTSWSHNDEKYLDFIKTILSSAHNIFCIISISHYAFRTRFNGKYLHEIIDVPVFFYEMDFTWSRPRLCPTVITDNFFLASCSEDVVGFWKRFISPDIRYTLANFGHGASPRFDCIDPDAETFSRRQNVLFMDANLSAWGKTLETLEQAIDDEFPAPIRRLARATIEGTLKDLRRPIPEAVLETMRDLGLELRQNEIFFTMTAVEIYHKLWRRLEILRRVIDLPLLYSGTPIPEEYRKAYPEKFCAASMTGLFEHYRNSRFCINSNLTSDNIHPRIFNSIRAGCAPVLQQNNLVDQVFEDGKSALIFNFTDRPIDRVIESYLDAPDAAAAIAAAAQQTLTENDYWDHNFRAMEAMALTYFRERQ